MEQSTQPAVVRVARRDEYPLVARMWLAMRTELHATPAGLRPDWVERFAGYHERRDAAGESRLLVAELDGAIVGTATALLLDGYPVVLFERPSTGYLFGIYVLPQHRRRGIARELTRGCIDWLRSAGCAVIRLRASADGRGLYESLGFATGAEMELRVSGSSEADCPGQGSEVGPAAES